MLVTADSVPTIEAPEGEGERRRRGAERLETGVFEQQGGQTIPGIRHDKNAGLLVQIHEAFVELAL